MNAMQVRIKEVKLSIAHIMINVHVQSYLFGITKGKPHEQKLKSKLQ